MPVITLPAVPEYRVWIDPDQDIATQYERHAREFRQHAESAALAGDADEHRQLLAVAEDCERLAASWRQAEARIAALGGADDGDLIAA